MANKVRKNNKLEDLPKPKPSKTRANRKVSLKSKRQSNLKLNQNFQKQKIVQKKIQQEKYLIMWSGVTFFMLLILILWIMNIRANFQVISLQSERSRNDFKALFRDFNQQVDKFEGVFSKSFSTSSLSSFPRASSSIIIGNGQDKSIERLKDKLENLEK